jgi:thymidylate kinase
MVIEFIGTPGSGKTILLPEVKRVFENHGFQAYEVVEAARPFAMRTVIGKIIASLTPKQIRQQILWQVFYFFNVVHRVLFTIRYPAFVNFVYKSQKQRPNQEDLSLQKNIHWFNYLIGSYGFLKSKARSNEALVFDEGFVHRVVQFNASDREQPNSKRIENYLDLIPKPDMIIYINASPDVCEERVIMRGIWDFFEHKTPAEISRYIKNSASIVEMTVEQIRNKGWTLIEIENNGNNPSGAIQEIGNRLSHHLKVFQINNF